MSTKLDARKRAHSQRGVAVVTALLLTTLAVTIVAGLFWHQQIQLRAMENQRLQLQTKWVLRSLLDWARIVLREDAKTTTVDHLGESWASPLIVTGLDEYVEDGGGNTKDGIAGMAGQIEDAQSRYNLRNLAQNGIPNMAEVAIFQRILASTGLNPDLGVSVAKTLAATQKAAPPATPASDQSSEQTASSAQPVAPTAIAAMPTVTLQPDKAQLARLDDLLTISGFTPASIDKLQAHVDILPQQTAVNANTADAVVVAALMGVAPGEITSLMASRQNAYFKDAGDFQNRTPGIAVPAGIAFKSNYFFVRGKVNLDKASVHMLALIYRKNTGNTSINWIREY